VSGVELEIRPFRNADGPHVRELFIEVNRLLSPPDLRDAFEAYIKRALADEIDRIEAYYAEHGGGFWVATLRGGLVGTLSRWKHVAGHIIWAGYCEPRGTLYKATTSPLALAAHLAHPPPQDDLTVSCPATLQLFW
jgi:hypothetical protein